MHWIQITWSDSRQTTQTRGHLNRSLLNYNVTVETLHVILLFHAVQRGVEYCMSGDCCVDSNISMCAVQLKVSDCHRTTGSLSLTRDVLHLTAIQYLQYWSVTAGSSKLCCCLELFYKFQCVEVFSNKVEL